MVHQRLVLKQTMRSASRSSVSTQRMHWYTCSGPVSTPLQRETAGSKHFSLTEVHWLEAQRSDRLTALHGYANVIDIWHRGGDWANQWLSLRRVLAILIDAGALETAAVLHGALSGGRGVTRDAIRTVRCGAAHSEHRSPSGPARAVGVRGRCQAGSDDDRPRDRQLRQRTDCGARRRHRLNVFWWPPHLL